jgi:hypothetical protein
MLNNITIILTPRSGILKSQPKVVVNIDKLVKFLVSTDFEPWYVATQKYSNYAHIHLRKHTVKQAAMQGAATME